MARLPPPASYQQFVARFLGLWTMTLPLVLLELMPLGCVPPVTLLVAWALYSTEELAKLLDAPFGAPGDEQDDAVTAPVPVEAYVQQIGRELRSQLVIARQLVRRVDDGDWVVTRDDLEIAPYVYGAATASPAEAAAAARPDDDDNVYSADVLDEEYTDDDDELDDV